MFPDFEQGSYYLQHCIDYSFAAYKVIIGSLMVSQLNIRKVRGSEV